jgi:hypothetical protein
MNQGDLAQVFEVDRSSVNAWGLKGLPHGKRGRSNTYDFSTTLYWRTGHKLSKDLGREIQPLHKIALGYLSAYDPGVFGKPELALFLDIAHRAGFTTEHAEKGFQFAAGLYSANSTTLRIEPALV